MNLSSKELVKVGVVPSYSDKYECYTNLLRLRELNKNVEVSLFSPLSKYDIVVVPHTGGVNQTAANFPVTKLDFPGQDPLVEEFRAWSLDKVIDNDSIVITLGDSYLIYVTAVLNLQLEVVNTHSMENDYFRIKNLPKHLLPVEDEEEVVLYNAYNFVAYKEESVTNDIVEHIRRKFFSSDVGPAKVPILRRS